MDRNLILGKCAYSSMIFFLFSFSSVQSLSCVQHFATPWTAARQASLSITNSLSLLKLKQLWASSMSQGYKEPEIQGGLNVVPFHLGSCFLPISIIS